MLPKLNARFASVVLILASTAGQACALEGVVPGKSQLGIDLGAPRAAAIAGLKARIKGVPSEIAYRVTTLRADGLVEDTVDLTYGTQGDPARRQESLDILSRHGRVIQIRSWTSGPRGKTDLSFAQLLDEHPLRKSVYGFDEPEGGGYVGFYYDDVRRGVCFTRGVQDDFLLTSHPDGIVVHPPGVAAIPVEGGIHGSPVTGADARAFASADEARKVDQSDQNDH